MGRREGNEGGKRTHLPPPLTQILDLSLYEKKVQNIRNMNSNKNTFHTYIK